MNLAKKGLFLTAVDADIVAYRVAAACENETLEEMYDTLRAAIYHLWKGTRTKHYLFALTGEENFRNEAAVTHPYKGNRKDVVRPRWLRAAKDYISDEYKGLVIHGMEADDIVVSASHRFGPGNTIIASIDKDLKQCAGYHYHLVKGEGFTMSRREAEEFLWTQVLTGDPTDNIKGLPNVGAKKAEVIINEAKEDGIPLPHAVWLAYKERGYDYDYFTENLMLIRMLVDLYPPYENHFTSLSFNPDEFEDTLAKEELDDEFDD